MKVFFLVTPSSRERQWDTVRNQPEGVEALIPEGISPKGSRATFAASRSWKGRLKNLAASLLPLPNVTFRTDVPVDAGLVYSWSKFPLRARKPFVIELDNPYALAYYSRRAIYLLRPLLRRWLKRAKHVAFMSEACGATFREVFGKLPVPQSVSYPFMPARNVTRTSSGKTRFLFVGLDFRIKGGPELIEGWRRAALPDATLRVVTTVTDEMREKYANVPGLVLEEAVSREALLNDVFPNADVFVYPTFFDSFGVVLLEALSFGLGIIATNLYATPELVEDGANGRLLAHPVLRPRDVAGRTLVSPVEIHAETFLAQHLGPGAFYEDFADRIAAALKEAHANSTAWQAASARRFQERFSPEAWQANMRRILS